MHKPLRSGTPRSAAGQRSIGKQGGGPGELQSPFSFTVSRDGDLVILDPGRSAFSLFATDGTFEDNVSFDMSEGMPLSIRLYPEPGGGLLTVLRPPMMMASGSAPPDVGAMFRRSIIRQPLEADGSRKTLYEYVPEASGTRSTSGSPANMRVTVQGPPTFTPQLLWTALPDGRIAVADEAGYAVKIVSPAGTLERRLERPFEARTVTERDREAAKELRRKSFESRSGGLRISVSSGSGMRVGRGSSGPRISAEQIERTLGSMRFAETRPVITNVAADPAGRIWVRRAGKKVGEAGPIDLLTADGEYLGTLSPTELIPAAWSPSGRAAYVETDELDIVHVTVRQLPERLR